MTDVMCAECGNANSAGQKFCGECGARLVAAPPSHEQRKRVTILFCDVTGSTALGEATDPEALRALLARYFERMKGIIESHGGTVEKFIGDAVMAVFGVPQLHEDDALRAVRAAAEMQEALPELGVQCRIGVNTGEVVTGTQERLATGDAVNVAARLEQAAASGEVLIGEETYRLVRDAVQVEAVVPLLLKGKREPVPAYRLVTVKQAAERRQLGTPMIGRDRELRRLQDSFAQAVDDRSCQLFTVLGSAGVGKSRLAMEFLQGVERAQVVRGRCLSYGEGITYFPVVDVIKQLDALPEDAYAAATLQSLLGEKTMATSPDEIAWAVRVLLEERAQDQPLVVVFDDIHWGEETFLDLIEHVADLSRDAPILLLCMARPELLEKRPGWGGGKWNATTVLLEPLNGEETDRLVDALGGVSQEMRERIRLAAEGNPLFVEEMLALLQESGGHDVVVPPTIQALLAARLDQLQPDERSVLEAGSVEGRVFHRSAVQVLSQEQGSLQGKLLGLVRKELVRPERAQLRGDEAYRFRHLLIRDAAYEALPKATRAELHERFAGWLEERGTGLIELDEIVGYHLEQAARYRSELGQPEQELAARAGERLARAGRQALWRGDKHSASTLLERALQLLRPIRWDTYLEIDLVDSLNLHAGEALSRMEEIARHAEAAGDDCGAAVARVMCVLWREFVSNEISVNDFEAETRATIALLERSGDHDGLIRAWDVLGFSVYNGALQYEGWAHATEQMIAHARAIGKPGVYTLPVAIANGPRPADDALATLDQLLREEPHPDVLAWHAALLAMLGRFDEARQEGSTAYQRAWELGAYPVRSLWALTQVEVFAGDYEAAAGHLGQMCESLEHQGNVNILSTFIGWLGRSLATLGRFDEAEDCARRGRELGIEEDLITQALWRQVLARVLAHRGEHPEAERLVREAIDLLEQADTLNIKGDAFCDLAEVLETAGKREEAIAALTQALALYQQKKNVAMVAQVKSRLDALAERDAEAPR